MYPMAVAMAVGLQLLPTGYFGSRGRSDAGAPAIASFPSKSSSIKPRRLAICSARVGGVEIPDNKRIEFALQYIHGIGRSTAKKILVDLNMLNKVTRDLSEEEIIALRNEVSKYRIEGDLRRFNANAIQFLKDIKCYRGLRHIQGLPCRGQRTRNNCRTVKDKRVPDPET